MSTANSNLMSVGYDTVIGITQNALNDTMKKYLSKVENDLDPVCYVYTDDTLESVKTIAYQDLLTQTTSADLPNGADPFAIADGSSNTSTDAETVAIGNALFNALFAFGFKASMGLPTGITPRNMPDIINLQDGTEYQVVNYQMYFKTFQIVQQIGGRNNAWTYSNLQQADDSPWIFQWQVNLNLESADFDNLPQTTQNSIKNLDNSSAFSVQQLLLDMSTPALASTLPTIQGLDPSSPAYEKLTSEFINTYWEALQNNGGAVFYETVQPTNSQPVADKPSIIPSDLDFIVTAYIPDPADGNLTTEQQQGLYTLNYLVMANGNQMPTAVSPLTWNWMSAEEGSQYSGVIAIKKDDFVSYLGELLSPGLKNVCVQPTADMKQDRLIDGGKLTYTWNYKQYDPAPVYQTVNSNNDPTHVLTCHFVTDKDQNTDNPGYDEIFGEGNFLVWSDVQADIFVQGTTIKCVTTVAVYLEIDLFFKTSKTRGYVYATKNTTIFNLGVSTEGVLQVNDSDPVPTNVDVRQSSDSNSAYYDGDLDPSLGADVVTFGYIKDLVNDNIQPYYSSHMSSLMSDYPSHILNLLNNMNAFVFPGASTFVYSKCCFSDHQDLTAMIKYTDPS